MTYPEALRFLAGKYGIEIEEEEMTEEAKEAKNKREGLYLVNNYAAEQFSKYLWEDEKGRAVGLSYFTNRGFDEKTIKEFKLGYCPEDGQPIAQKAVEDGYSGESVEESGLGIKRGENYFDRFRGRVIFPIHNLSGRVIGFGGRTLRSDKKIAKYVNSPETDIYNKSRELYGLFFAKKDAVKEDQVYLVEGYTDVVSMWQSGVTNACAPLGTSLTEDQVKLIRRYTQNVILLFDGDDAGLKATARAIDMVLEAGLNAHVVLFPEGQDPDTYSKEHSDDELKSFLENNRIDFIRFHLQTAGKEWEHDPIKKSEVMKTILRSISKIPDHLLRSLFVKEFAQRTNVNEQSAIYEVNKLRKAFLKKEYGNQDALPTQPIETTLHNEEEKKMEGISTEKKEEKLVSYLIKYAAEHLAFPSKEEGGDPVQIPVAEYIVTLMERDEVIFRHDVYRRIYDYFKGKVEAYEAPDERDLLANSDEEMKEVIYSLLTSKHELSENWSRKYHIETPAERDHLLNHINKDIYAMKLAEIMVRLNEFEERMKTAGEEELIKLLNQQKKLSEAKKAFAKELGMTIS